jgi:hypothetical protein
MERGVVRGAKRRGGRARGRGVLIPRESPFTAGLGLVWGYPLQRGRGGRIEPEKRQWMSLAGADGEADGCAPCLGRALHMESK